MLLYIICLHVPCSSVVLSSMGVMIFSSMSAATSLWVSGPNGDELSSLVKSLRLSEFFLWGGNKQTALSKITQTDTTDSSKPKVWVSFKWIKQMQNDVLQ